MKKKAIPTKMEEAKNPEDLTLQMDINDKRTKAEFISDELLGMGSVGNAILIKSFRSGGQVLDLDACVRTLRVSAKKVSDGDNSGLEGMLSTQAIALNTIFTSLATRAILSDLMPHMETFMGFALKAQNQCRASIDTLAQIKNPRQTVITKQANISTGPQQVNNTLNQITEPESKIPENSETSQNKLLSHEQAERPYMDTGAASKASEDNSAMATMDTVNRASNRSRQSDSINQRA